VLPTQKLEDVPYLVAHTVRTLVTVER